LAPRPRRGTILFTTSATTRDPSVDRRDRGRRIVVEGRMHDPCIADAYNAEMIGTKGRVVRARRSSRTRRGSVTSPVPVPESMHRTHRRASFPTPTIGRTSSRRHQACGRSDVGAPTGATQAQPLHSRPCRRPRATDR
jgi:hypothetical protein